MSAALELIETVRANGGWLRVEGDTLVIAPDSAALPVVGELRKHKVEIIRLLETNSVFPIQDPEAWRAPFAEWLKSECVYHPRAFGGLACLHRDYCEWEIARDGVPCTGETFTALLSESGFLMGEIRGTVLVSGLVFKSDATAQSLC